jgi:hypothetical protein
MFVMALGMKYLALFLVVLCCAGGTLSADDQVRRVQEALRKRNLYFGEIDGRKNAEVTGALKRFQQRQGLPANGDVTQPTLTSLGISGTTKPGEEWPEGPVLKSDVARRISEADRRFLESNPSPVPDPIADTEPEPSPAAPPVVISPEANPPPGKSPEPSPPSTKSPEPRTATTKSPERPPCPRPVAEAPTPADAADTPTQFVRKYLAACETNHLAEEMRFYGPRMNYFDHGLVDSAFVARDVQHYYKRWPHRRYELLDCKITPLKESEWKRGSASPFTIPMTKSKRSPAAR